MLISYTHKFIFVHVGKTGGTSIREALEPYSEEPERFRICRPPKLSGSRPNIMYTIWRTLLLHPRARDIRRELPPDVYANFYKFAFVRNPWDWQVSMYHFLLREPTAAKHAEVKELERFEAFLEWVIETPNPYPRGISKLQSDMLADSDGNILVDFVGRYETITEDFWNICRRIQIQPRLSHLNQSNHRDYRTYYTSESRKLIEKHFQADIALFGYTFDGVVPSRLSYDT
jgi:hypothetical protein